MRDRLKVAAEEGIVLGVKWGIVIVLVCMAVVFALGDYNIVRQRAANGQQAWEFIQKVNASPKSETK